MSTPESTPSVEHGNAGHAHRCSREHRWQHSGPSAEDCALLARDPYNGVLSEADCAVCSGRDDLLTRAPHTHHCQFCDVEWVHEGRCVDGLAAWCPWDFPGVAGGTPTGTRTGRHLHYCPDCRTQWPHHESCAAPFRVVLPGCPGCVPGGLLNEVKRIGGKVGSSLRGEAWEVSRSRRLWGTIAGVSGAILLGLLNEVKRIGGKVGSSLRGEAWEVSRSRWLWGTIAGVSAAILLGSLGFPPVNLAPWRAPAEQDRVAVAPAPQPAERTVERLPLPPALPAERPPSDPGGGEPRVDEPAAPGPHTADRPTSPPQATLPALVLPPTVSGGIGSQTRELSPGSPPAPSPAALPPVPSGSVPPPPAPASPPAAVAATQSQGTPPVGDAQADSSRPSMARAMTSPVARVMARDGPGDGEPLPPSGTAISQAPGAGGDLGKRPSESNLAGGAPTRAVQSPAPGATAPPESLPTRGASGSSVTPAPPVSATPTTPPVVARAPTPPLASPPSGSAPQSGGTQVPSGPQLAVHSRGELLSEAPRAER